MFCLVFKLVPQFYLGLVNRSQGIVKKIWYQPWDDPKTHKLPAVVFVECPGYSGMYVCLHIQTLSDKYTRSLDTRLAWGWSIIGSYLSSCFLMGRSVWKPTFSWTASTDFSIGNHHTQKSGSHIRLCYYWPWTKGLFIWAVICCHFPGQKIEGAAFCVPFGIQHLQCGEETESMRMLREDNTRQEALGFTLDTYGIDLGEYVFNE